MKRSLLAAIVMTMAATFAAGQEKLKIKFGKVDPEDFKTTVYSIDSSASAVVLADVGSTSITGNNKGWFSLEHKHFKRVHVLNKNGYDIGNVEVSLYADGNREEELLKLKAVTYNLENGKVVETKLETRSGVFKEKINKNWVRQKFTFPNLKEGSIIEFEYTIKSDFLFNLRPWEFQGAYPRLWSEYNVSIPQFISYVFLSQGYLAPYIKDKKDRQEAFAVTDNSGSGPSERYTFTSGVTDHRWVMKDVPVLKEEGFTSTLDNHIAKIEFQLSEYREPLAYKNIMGSWSQLGKELSEAEYFGGPLQKNNGWLGETIDDLIKGAQGDREKAKRIFSYVQNNFTRTRRGGLYLDQNLRNIAKSKKGTTAEINLLLVAMLRYANITADPLMLSTRSHGYTYAMYPLIDRFNYVVAMATIDGRPCYLDAAEPKLGFGRLAYDCYNGHARIMNASATPVDLLSDSLMERKVSSIFMVNSKEKGIIGSMQQTPGYYESMSLRERISEKGQEQLFADIKKAYNADIEISDPVVDSLKNFDENLKIKYDFTFKHNNEDIIYFNPMFGEGYKNNPFKSAERMYPVEVPYAMDETYLLRMDVPEGYALDELPKQVVVKLSEDEPSFFEYRIAESNGTISLRSRLYITRTYYQPEEYEMLREFFNLVVKKHGEQIVFKKK
ncbi:MAG TPA: transglutaminase domain-containing protein [Chitinophagaceae bacterium]|nr:transglutaminase domain-containing protein [Chitinophagaceae bacterium]